MKKIASSLFIVAVIVSSLFSAPGIDPDNPLLNTEKIKELYTECEDNSRDSIDICEKAILYELHHKRRMHKGASFGVVSPQLGSWLDALAQAEAETDLFAPINFNVDTSLMNSMQANTNLLSMGYQMTSKMSKLNESIDTYSALMRNISKQSVIEFKIETVITQLLYEREMAKELEKFSNSKQGTKK